MSDREIQTALRQISGFSLATQWDFLEQFKAKIRNNLLQTHLLFKETTYEGDTIGHLANITDTVMDILHIEPSCNKLRGYHRGLPSLAKLPPANENNISCTVCLNKYKYLISKKK